MNRNEAWIRIGHVLEILTEKYDTALATLRWAPKMRVFVIELNKYDKRLTYAIDPLQLAGTYIAHDVTGFLVSEISHKWEAEIT